MKEAQPIEIERKATYLLQRGDVVTAQELVQELLIIYSVGSILKWIEWIVERENDQHKKRSENLSEL